MDSIRCSTRMAKEWIDMCSDAQHSGWMKPNRLPPTYLLSPRRLRRANQGRHALPPFCSPLLRQFF